MKEVLEEVANEENEDWGVNCSLFQNCNLMTINKNTPISSASQLSIYVQNVRSLGTQITSTKFTRPLDHGCDVYIFVDARVTESRMRQLWSNFKVRMSDMQVYNTYSQNRGILILCKKLSGCTIENAELVDTDSTVIYDFFHPGCTSYTWIMDNKSQKRAKKASRIDHILVSPSLTKFC